MTNLNISNIKNQINRIKNCVRDTYVVLDSKDAILPATNNVDSIANTIQNIPTDSDRVLNLKSNNGVNYDYLYAGYQNETFDLSELNFINVRSMKGFIEGANNLSNSFLNNFYKKIPNSTQFIENNNRMISYFGLNGDTVYNIPGIYSHVLISKGWFIDNHIFADWIQRDNSGTVYHIGDDLTNRIKLLLQNCKNQKIRFKLSVPSYMNVESTSKIKDFSNMFNNCVNLTDIINLDMRNISNGSYTFNNCRNLININLASPNNYINKLQNSTRMFHNCLNLTTLPFQLNNCLNLEIGCHMFDNCRKLQEIPNIYTNNLINSAYMFAHCYNIKQNFSLNLDNLENGSSMFYYANNASFNIPTLPNLLYGEYMFSETKINYIPNFPQASSLCHCFRYSNYLPSEIKDISFSNARNAWGMFSYTQNIQTVENISFYRKNFLNLVSLFENSKHLTNVRNIDFTTNNYFPVQMNLMFANCSNLTDVSNIKFSQYDYYYANHMTDMFANARKLTTNSLENIFNALPKIFKPASIHEIGIMNEQLSDFIEGIGADSISKAQNNNWTFPTISLELFEKYKFNVVDISETTHQEVVFSIIRNGDTSRAEPLFVYPLWLMQNLNNYKDNAKSIEITKYSEDRKNFINLCKDFTKLENFNFNYNFIRNLYGYIFDNMFQNCYNLKNVIMNFDMENKGVSTFGMFQNCYNLKNILNVVHQNNIANMYKNCNSLTDATFTMNGSSGYVIAINISSMFENCTNLKNVNITTKILPNYYGGIFTANAFQNCIKLTNCNIKPLQSANGYFKIYNSVNMFRDCQHLTTMGIPATLNNSYGINGYNAVAMYRNCYNLKSIDKDLTLNQINNTSNMFAAAGIRNAQNINMNHGVDCSNNMFNSCSYLTNIKNIYMDKVTNASCMFKNCYNLTMIESINTINLKDASEMFKSCNNLSEIPNNMYFGNITNMTRMFEDASSINSFPVMDFKSATNLYYAFFNVTAPFYSGTSDLCNLINALPNFNQITTPNAVNDLYYLGIDDIYVEGKEIPEEVAAKARVKGWDITANMMIDSVKIYNIPNSINVYSGYNGYNALEATSVVEGIATIINGYSGVRVQGLIEREKLPIVASFDAGDATSLVSIRYLRNNLDQGTWEEVQNPHTENYDTIGITSLTEINYINLQFENSNRYYNISVNYI